MECKNSVGFYSCHCPHGLRRNPLTDKCEGKLLFTFIRSTAYQLLDINECEEENVCANGKCRNTDGGFRCRCNPGFEPSKDGTECIGKANYH